MEFLEEVGSLALQIARRQRGEDGLQDINAIFDKFNKEWTELIETANIWDEVPDVLYYAACAAIQGSPHLMKRMPTLLKSYGVTMKQAQAACLAKYRLRAAGNPKDIEAERVAIMEAIR